MLADAGALDFGDLLLKTVELFERFPEVLAHYRRRWQYVLVDEYQDTNRVQYRLVQQLVSEHGNLCVVGDPDQSIYAWRGADIHNILDFERDYPGAVVVKLERNYRSTQPILAGASGVVSHNIARKRKDLFTEREGGGAIRLFEAGNDREEAQLVVREIAALVREEGRAYGDCAIFYRTNAQSRIFEDELLACDVPYVVVGGVRFYDRAEVKDALAYLRLALNPADGAALRRIVNKPARGIGKASLDRAEALAEQHGTLAVRGAAPLRGERGGRAGRAADPRVHRADRGDRTARAPRGTRAARSRTCSTARATSTRSSATADSRPRAGSRTCASCSRPPRTSRARTRRCPTTTAARSSCSSTRSRSCRTSTATIAATTASR